MRPRFILLAGPNGSGKSSLASGMDLTGIDDVINPDTIRSPDGNLASALQAGCLVIHRTAENFATGRSFLLETTLSGNREARVVAEARQRGYQVDVIFVCVGDVRLNILRVQLRVEQGGHFVPEEDIRRRYDRSLENLRAIIPLSNSAVLFDNSGGEHKRVARFEDGILRWRAEEPPGWLSRVLDEPRSGPMV
ncbi:MAG: zeta toxin family protein [Bryobacteraceae bacterium]